MVVVGQAAHAFPVSGGVLLGWGMPPNAVEFNNDRFGAGGGATWVGGYWEGSDGGLRRNEGIFRFVGIVDFEKTAEDLGVNVGVDFTNRTIRKECLRIPGRK